MPPRILILDDEPKIAELLRRSLQREGYEVACKTSPAAALEYLKAHAVDVFITDLKMPGMDGLEALRRAKAIRPACEVVVMTAYATIETAREALKRGAIDYLTKPFSADDDLKPLLRKVFEENAAGAGASGAAGEAAETPASGAGPASAGAGAASALGRILTRNPAMKAILAQLPRIAASRATVLIRGESGTGKELIADAIHALSPRADGPLVKVNCGALPETLLESELFGHVKGSFTGAVADREGRFQMADGGTLFLDEIGEISPALQVKLLRALQQGEIQRVGDSTTLRVDVRVVAATNRDLEAMLREGTFRQDLFYRLNVVPVALPPLRERCEDILPLAENFARRFAPGREVVFSPEARQSLESYHWPGNIRELENAVEHAIVLGDPDQLRLEDFPITIQDFRRRQAGEAGPAAVGEATLEDIERRCLVAALQKTNFNQTRAARLLGVTRRTLGYRIRKFGLDAEIERLRRQDDAEV